MTQDHPARSPGCRAPPDAARRDGAEAFAALVREHERPLFGHIYRMMGDPDDDADLTQETFLKAYRAWPGTPADLNAGAWLHRIACNCCLDVLRRRQLVRWRTWDAAAEWAAGGAAGDPEGIFVHRETDAAVRATVARMSPRNGRALVLRAYDGLSCREVGAAMGVTDEAARAQLVRARAEFRRLAATPGVSAATVTVPSRVDESRSAIVGTNATGVD